MPATKPKTVKYLWDGKHTVGIKTVYARVWKEKRELVCAIWPESGPVGAAVGEYLYPAILGLNAVITQTVYNEWENLP